MAQLNRWLTAGFGIAVYQHDDRSIAPVLAHHLVSYGGPGAFIESPELPSTLDEISLFDGPFTLVGKYPGGALPPAPSRTATSR